MEEKRGPGRPPKPEGPKVALNLRVPADLKAKLIATAGRYGEDVTTLVERAVRAELNRIERRERRTG